MIKILLLVLIMFLSNCSFNNNSKFWTEDSFEKKKLKNELKQILEKSDNLMSLTFNEYDIYINEYSKNSGYPNINK